MGREGKIKYVLPICTKRNVRISSGSWHCAVLWVDLVVWKGLDAVIFEVKGLYTNRHWSGQNQDVNCRESVYITTMGRGEVTENWCKSYCSTVHFCRITSIYQPTNAHIISHNTLLKHFRTLRHFSILSDHHQGALFLAKVILQYSQFSSCVARCASYDAHLATAPQHNMICCHNTSFANTNWIVNTVI